MQKRLTDRQKKRIIADRVEGLSIRQIAAKHKVSTTTVLRTIQKDPDIQQKLSDKKAQNTADIMEHMDKQRDKVCEIIDTYLEALLDQERIDRANPAQLTTALGTVIDKWTLAKAAAEDKDKDSVKVIIDV